MQTKKGGACYGDAKVKNGEVAVARKNVEVAVAQKKALIRALSAPFSNQIFIEIFIN